MAKPSRQRSDTSVDPSVISELLELSPHDDAASRVRELAGDAPGGELGIVEALGGTRNETAGRVLAAVAVQATDKQVRKAARRSLHKLRAAGIAVNVPSTAVGEGRPAAAELARLVEAHASFVDGIWSRSLWLLYERPLGGVNVFGMVVNGVVGVKDCTFRDTTRKRFVLQLQDWRDEQGITLVDLPPEYALALVSEALALNAETGYHVPTELQLHRAQLGTLPPPPEQALIHQHITRGQSLLMPDLLEHSPQILDEEELGGWFFGFDESLRHAHELRRLRDSPILLAGGSREEREERALAVAVDELFTPEVRRAARRGLEENAFVFWKTDRERAARQAVAAAFSLGQGSLAANPFARAMVQRSTELALEAESAGMDPALLRRTPYDSVD
jgi:hypothetical protein